MNQTFHRQIERTELLNELSRLPDDQRSKLIEEYRERSEKAFAPATLKHCRMILRLFSEWCDKRGHPILTKSQRAVQRHQWTPQHYPESFGSVLAGKSCQRTARAAEVCRMHFVWVVTCRQSWWLGVGLPPKCQRGMHVDCSPHSPLQRRCQRHFRKNGVKGKLKPKLGPCNKAL